MKKTVLTENDYNNFYKTMLYGAMNNVFDVAIRAAYRDLCRTITGFSKHERHNEIWNNCAEIIYDGINELIKHKEMSQKDFNLWHESISKKLVVFFETQKFTIGQAQKWINMTLKYLSMFNHELIENIYEYCHVPIDNYIINITGYDKFNSAWSRIESYDEYMEFQVWFRNKYNDKIPLDAEFELWIEATKIERNK